ncbi:MAG: hypothetical protein JWQ98_2976 [Chlorobi bacterium]|nr:hypothetical protein [Chlorobiota bacterium]
MSDSITSAGNGAAEGMRAPHAVRVDAGDNSPIDVVENMMRNLDLANRIANDNLAHQNAIQHQQAMLQLQLAAVGKCTEMIMSIDAASPDAPEQIRIYEGLIDMFMKQFGRITEVTRVGDLRK